MQINNIPVACVFVLSYTLLGLRLCSLTKNKPEYFTVWFGSRVVMVSSMRSLMDYYCQGTKLLTHQLLQISVNLLIMAMSWFIIQMKLLRSHLNLMTLLFFWVQILMDLKSQISVRIVICKTQYWSCSRYDLVTVTDACNKYLSLHLQELQIILVRLVSLSVYFVTLR